MKVNGKVLEGPRVVKIYLPIANEGAVEFKFRPLRSDEDFEKILSKPKPKQSKKPNGEVFSHVDDPGFRAAIGAWANKKMDWEFLTSIGATEGLEWETVVMADPETWGNWRADLEKAFGVNGANAVFQGFIEAQYITEEVMERARACFLTGLLELPGSSPPRRTNSRIRNVASV